jgi:hypothetical protein
MSDIDPQTRDLRAALDSSSGAKQTRNVPPLVWIVIVVLIALAAYAYFGRQKDVVTAHGEHMPAVSSSAAVPASGG